LEETAAGVASWLQTPEAIRERCGAILSRGLAGGLDGGLEHFEVIAARLEAVAARVAEVTRRTYPDLAIPLHGRFLHFAAGGVDRAALLAERERRSGLDPLARARARVDLVTTSVLLDAGAGARWRYRDAANRLELERSEGLAVASFDAFVAGTFSSDRRHPLAADAAALGALDESTIARAFQVRSDNRLVGLAGRTELLRALGRALAARPDLFGCDPPRPGGIVDRLRADSHDARVRARDLLALILDGFGSIWPGRNTLDGVALGDVWRHPAAGGAGAGAGLVPFHKLSQWLAYSLVEPLGAAGIVVDGLDELTALAEYRNGGLLVDLGVLVPRDVATLEREHAAGDEPIVEWRALTVALIDRVAERVRDLLGARGRELGLGQILEGGTWRAGREVARERRPDGSPPLWIASDGTVF